MADVVVPLWSPRGVVLRGRLSAIGNRLFVVDSAATAIKDSSARNRWEQYIYGGSSNSRVVRVLRVRRASGVFRKAMELVNFYVSGTDSTSVALYLSTNSETN